MCFGNCDRSGMDLCQWRDSFCRNAVDKGKWKGTDCNYSGEKGNGCVKASFERIDRVTSQIQLQGEKDDERIKYLMLY